MSDKVARFTTEHIEPHENGGFVTYGDYLRISAEIGQARNRIIDAEAALRVYDELQVSVYWESYPISAVDGWADDSTEHIAEPRDNCRPAADRRDNDDKGQDHD